MNAKKTTRNNFRSSVFARDGNKCVMCDETVGLSAHHITDRNEMPNGGYVLENGITLCPECHIKAELWHQTDGENFLIGYTPYNLYIKIGSNYRIAYKKSITLDN
jgi:5-methylcytosine-specific restriction endonuclease McrA